MVHDNNCDYNPYVVEAYYQGMTSQRDEEEQEQKIESE